MGVTVLKVINHQKDRASLGIHPQIVNSQVDSLSSMCVCPAALTRQNLSHT